MTDWLTDRHITWVIIWFESRRRWTHTLAVIPCPAVSLGSISTVTLVAVSRTAQKHLVHSICHQQKESYHYKPTHSISRRAVLEWILAIRLLMMASALLLLMIGKALEEVWEARRALLLFPFCRELQCVLQTTWASQHIRVIGTVIALTRDLHAPKPVRVVHVSLAFPL